MGFRAAEVPCEGPRQPSIPVVVRVVRSRGLTFEQIPKEFRTKITRKKGDRFVAQLKQPARNKGLKFPEKKSRPKGGHAMVWVGDKVITFPFATDRQRQWY